MSAGAMTGQQALCALVDARAMERAVHALKARCQQLEHQLDFAASEADLRANQALHRIDELAMCEPGQLGFNRTTEQCWQTILRVTQKTTALETDASELLERRNGEASA